MSKKLLKELWNKYRCDRCERVEDAGTYSNPITIFGLFRQSNKRKFMRRLIALDIRPFELWDRGIERKSTDRLSWFDDSRHNNLAILFECEDGSKILGVINGSVYKKLNPIRLGDSLMVVGVYETIHQIKSQDVYLVFRIKTWSK